MHRSLSVGQTLIEVLLSITIIITGLVTLITTLVNAQASSNTTVQDVVALYLARENVEAVRFIRDSNWLKRDNGLTVVYDDGLHSGTETDDYTGIYLWKQTLSDPGTALSLDFTSDSITATQATIYQNGAGLYRQFLAPPGSGWTTTPYRRFVTLYPICSTDGGVTQVLLSADEQNCGSLSQQIGIQVKAEVQWESHGSTHSRVIEEQLYDWKYAQS
ncbi:MAG: hypothetical protein WCV88_01760 [Patescibacteria group bacterium]|jgi:Tfp pilus assembly protein PilV